MHSLDGLAPNLPGDLRQRVVVRWPKDYQWVYTWHGGNQIRDMLRERVPVVAAAIPQPYKGTIVSEFQIDGRTYEIAFNTSDYPDFLAEESVRRSLVTFKSQYLKSGYSYPNVVPAGYLPASPRLYKMLSYLRWAKDRLARRFDVYARFGMTFAPGVRGPVLRALGSAGGFQLQGGGHTVRYSRYLREVARARVCVDLPGQGPFCTRLVEYLAIGSCVVGIPHPTQFQAPLVDAVQLLYSRPDGSDVVARCEALLSDRSQRTAMEGAARAFFDRYLHRDQLSAYYLATVLAAAGAN